MMEDYKGMSNPSSLVVRHTDAGFDNPAKVRGRVRSPRDVLFARPNGKNSPFSIEAYRNLGSRGRIGRLRQVRGRRYEV